MGILNRIGKILIGNYKMAVKNGMKAEDGVTVMGGVDFGSEPYLIWLHKHCRLSSNVTFITHDGGTWAFRNTNDRYRHVIKYGTIEVGEYSFIGANSTIMPGVRIGNNSVIGAGSVVTRSIPDGMVAVGVPAKVICTTQEYAEKCLQQMPKDFDEEAYLKDKRSYLTNLLWRTK